jgi:NitT/TauT family transport system permease protein
MSIADQTPPGMANEDADEARRARANRIQNVAKWVLPIFVMTASILAWHLYVTINEIPHYILPSPFVVLKTMVTDWGLLVDAATVTTQLTLWALLFAVIGGVFLAVLFTQSKWAEMSFFPYAVILQVTPVIAVAPLIQIYVDSAFAAALICAWIVAFFPILSNTTIGLKSADHNLRDLLEIYGATKWQKLVYLEAPSALPFFLGGLKIAGGLALIGAVVAEFVIGRSGTGLGLASTLLEASYRYNFARLYASLFMISGLGIMVFAATSLISHLCLRSWHESALKREN